MIDESARDEPRAHQLKYYARGVGNVRVYRHTAPAEQLPPAE